MSTFVSIKEKIVMPRKNSGMWYEVHPTPVKGEDGRNLVYVRPKSGLKLTMRQLEEQCERYNALRYGELSRAFDAFIRVAGRFLANTYRCKYYCSQNGYGYSCNHVTAERQQSKQKKVTWLQL